VRRASVSVAGLRTAVTAFMVVLAGLSGGCATTGVARQDDPRDPLEGFNRAMFSFNEGFDTVLLKPVAKGYDVVMPLPVKTGVANFFGNIADVFIGVNDLLQGKPGDAVGDAGRFIFNSTFGVLGLFDFASTIGLDKHDEDFGQTMGRWGMGPGPYLVVPVFGPRDMRDAAGLALDIEADPVGHLSDVPVRNSLTAVRFVSIRADLLPADKIIEEAALDKYSYIRDAYLQRRRSQVYDGHPPPEPDDE